MGLVLKPGTSWWETYGRCVSVAPEAFDSDRLRNLTRGEWRRVGIPGDHVNPVDGTPIPGPPRVDLDEAQDAVTHACSEHQKWSGVDLDERRARVTAAVDAMTEHRDLLALLLVWEIGKPWRLACADVDRCLDGVRWYVGEIERQLAFRTSPAGTTR
jgi:acyl-CoA reductase-like NAD-dependent aldehyde dehydrogenase